MSNCAFWSVSGELLALHQVGAENSDPWASFGPWAASRGLPHGRLIALSLQFPLPAASPPTAGWQALPAAPAPRRRKADRACDSSAPVATPAPALDSVSAKFLPPLFTHPKFTVKASPTWVLSCRPAPAESAEGWYAALIPETRTSRFLVRLLPYRGRLPGEGWRNMLIWALGHHAGVKLVPLNGLPTAQALSSAPAWEYRVEAGRGSDAAAWDLQILPSRRLLNEWAPGITDAWEATALLRWVRPYAASPDFFEKAPEGEPRWADLFARLPVADARLLVQNVLTTLPGGASEAAVLFFDDVFLSLGNEGRPLVRHTPQEGLPLALLSTLFGKRAWHEIDRAKRFLPPDSERKLLRSEALADLDRRLAEGRLEWSVPALDLWQVLYRDPRHRALQKELAEFRQSDRWNQVLSGDARVPEALLRGLDVTDATLCLRDVPDARWRRFVTARREAELRAEMVFCRAWSARGELTVERELEAWHAWDELLASLPLTEIPSGK